MRTQQTLGKAWDLLMVMALKKTPFPNTFIQGLSLRFAVWLLLHGLDASWLYIYIYFFFQNETPKAGPEPLFLGFPATSCCLMSGCHEGREQVSTVIEGV
jgi:hypothetical protein